MDILDADWKPAEERWESPTKCADPVRYTGRCRRIRRDKGRRAATLLQRLLLGSALFFTWSVILLLLWG